ncbi:peptidoglycan-binding protein [Kitasatospora sp. NPDC058190]|uniref:peptidoglycan-binding domain-containing protein n=1 Tax=Kitasatospora sp. NPDC058190 TaxID=3346371 RepID=UPI0036DA9E36
MKITIRKAGPVAAVLLIASAATTGLAGSASAAPGASWLGYGYTTSGPGVRCAQAAINSWDGAGLSQDGVFGPDTEAAVRQFQSERGLRVDGIVGPQTGDLLWQQVSDSNCYAYLPTSH